MHLKYFLAPKREDVLRSFGENSWAIEHAPDSLKGDKQFMMAAISKDGTTLRFASEELRSDREVSSSLMFWRSSAHLPTTFPPSRCFLSAVAF